MRQTGLPYQRKKAQGHRLYKTQIWNCAATAVYDHIGACRTRIDAGWRILAAAHAASRDGVESLVAGQSSEYKRLEELIAETQAFCHSPEKPFRLASGVSSPYYFDLRKLNGHPEGINAVAEIFYHMIKQIGGIKAVGGLESGSIPIASAVSQLSFLEHKKDPENPLLGSFYVRKEAKKHGSAKRIEGNPESPAVIVDDVITSGNSAIKAMNALKDEGHQCRCLISVIFRGTEENYKNIERAGRFEYLFTEEQLVKKLKGGAGTA